MNEVHANNNFQRNIDITSLTNRTNKGWNTFNSRNINESEEKTETQPLKKRFKTYNESVINNGIYGNTTYSIEEESYNNCNNGVQNNKLNHVSYHHNTPSLPSKSNISKFDSNSPSYFNFNRNNDSHHSNVNSDHKTPKKSNNDY
ncbi:hypothetical protein H8356DRAFT_848337, partial [Neocallimastix lanati (nom. inval.)]